MNQLLMGNEIFAHAALEAGVNVVAGYPGTPSSEVVETVAKLHAAGRAQGVHVEWSTNEKAALELLAGAAYSGARCLFTCKQVGLNVASDPLMSLNYVGVKGGMVLFVADDPGPISSQTEQDTRRFGAFAKLPVLDPANPEQGFAMMQYAFELSEQYHTPVIVRSSTRVSHSSAFMDIAETTQARPIPEEGFVKDPKWIIFPRRAYQAHGEINDRLAAIAQGCQPWLDPVEDFGQGAPRVGIVAGGISYSYVAEACQRIVDAAAAAGIFLPAFRLMQIGQPYPFPQDYVAQQVAGLDAVLAYEELDYVIEDELTRLAGTRGLGYRVCGKLTGHARTRGENDVDDAVARVTAFLDECAGTALTGLMGQAGEGTPAASAAYAEAAAELPVRPPVLCAGCPHRGSFYSVKRALGGREGIYCGDIGCYTMGNAAPLYTTDTCLCMGAGITIAQGFAVAQPGKKAIAFVGDSTFFASGLTGCANAVYNQHDITVVVLDNATTAMTGGQPHPGTGITLMGPTSKPISIRGVLEALGFQCIITADPLNLAESIPAAKQAIDFEGPSALIFESPCVQLRRPEPPAAIDPDLCTGCKKCITEIGCPGIGFDNATQGPRSRNRGQAFVNATQCNGCGLCTQVCPFKAISMTEGR